MYVEWKVLVAMLLVFSGVAFYVRRLRKIAKEDKRREEAWADDHEIRGVDWNPEGVLVISLASGKTFPVEHFSSWSPIDQQKECATAGMKLVSLKVAEGESSRRICYSISESVLYGLEKSLPKEQGFGLKA